MGVAAAAADPPRRTARTVSSTIVLLALLSAALHPVRDLVLKDAPFRESAYLGVNVTWVACAAIHTALTGADPLSPLAHWPLLAGSAIGLFAYYWGTLLALRFGDLSVYYPIIRASPAVVVLIGIALLGTRYPPATLAGVALTVLGAILLQRRPGHRLLAQPAALAAATAAMVGSAVYTLADAAAMRSLEVGPFLLWVYGALALAYPIAYGATRPAGRTRTLHLLGSWTRAPGRILVAAVVSYVSYLFILIGFQLGGEAAAVASVRLAAIPISVVLGAIVLGEPALRARLAWSGLIALGILLIVKGG